MFKSFTDKRPTTISPATYAVEIMDKLNALIESAGIVTVYWKGNKIDSHSKTLYTEHLKFTEYDAANFENWAKTYTRTEVLTHGNGNPGGNTSYREVNTAIAFTVDEVKYVVMCNTTNAGADYLNFITLTNVITPENEMSYMEKHRSCSYGYSEYGVGSQKFKPFADTESPTTYTVLRDSENKFFALFCKCKNGALDYENCFFMGHCGIDNLGPTEMGNNLANITRKYRLTTKLGVQTREEETGLINPLTEYHHFDTETNIDLNNGKVYLQSPHIYLLNYGLMGTLKNLKFATIHGTKDLEPLSISGHTYYKLPLGLYWRSV